MNKIDGFGDVDTLPEEVKTIMKLATAAFGNYQEKAAVLAEQMDREVELQLETERNNLRDWLKSWMPESLIPFVDLTRYQESDAKYSNYERGIRGTILKLAVPGAYPVFFRVYYIWNGVNYGYKFGDWEHENDNACFMVPIQSKMVKDEDGDPIVDYSWPISPNYKDLLVALGAAHRLWSLSWERLQDEWFALQAAPECEPADEPDEPEPPADPLERIALTLGSISQNLESLVMYKSNYGI